MKLYCVRHGEAYSSFDDPQRGLTDSGKHNVERLAEFLKRNKCTVPHVLHSPKTRAKQTGEIFAKILKAETITESPTLLNEDALIDPLKNMILTWTDDTMLVGHLPFMSHLVSALVMDAPDCSPIINFTPATIVCLLPYENRWIISWVLRPEIFEGSSF